MVANFMHNKEFVLESGMHKILWDFEIRTDHRISVRRLDLVVNFAIPDDHRIRLKEREKRHKHLDLKLLWNMKVTVIRTPHSQQRIDTGTRKLGKNELRLSKLQIGQNIKKSPGDVRRLEVTQSSVKDYTLMLVWETLKGFKGIW